MCLRQVDGINAGVLEARLRVPFRVIKRETGTVAPFVAEGVEARVSTGRPRLQILTADDIHHATHGIRTIESRRSTFHNLDAPDVFEIHAIVVDVIHRLTCHAFTVDQKENGISTEATHVERRLLAHGQAELQSRNLLRKHVLNVGGIGNLDVMGCDEARDHGCILQCLWRMRCRHDNRIQFHRVANRGLCHNTDSWHSPSHASYKCTYEYVRRALFHFYLSLLPLKVVTISNGMLPNFKT